MYSRVVRLTQEVVNDTALRILPTLAGFDVLLNGEMPRLYSVRQYIAVTGTPTNIDIWPEFLPAGFTGTHPTDGWLPTMVSFADPVVAFTNPNGRLRFTPSTAVTYRWAWPPLVPMGHKMRICMQGVTTTDSSNYWTVDLDVVLIYGT